MTDNQPTETKGLQFDKAEFSNATPANSVCVACKAAITHEYFQTNGKVICPPCRESIDAQLTGGSANNRFIKALVLGIGAGIAGCAIYYTVYKLSESQWGLISILVGYMVGWAINKGSAGRGGWVYQTMAVLITYLSIVGCFIPILHDIDATIPVISLIITSIALPFLNGTKGFLGILIIGFGVYQAWRMNKKLNLNITGPFTIGSTGAL
jgi:hypothetical protein